MFLKLIYQENPQSALPPKKFQKQILNQKRLQIVI